MKKQIATDQAPSAPAMLSQAIVSNGLIYVAGQVHATADNSLVEGSTAEKLDQVMQNITAILSAAGAQMDDVLKVTIYVTDMAIMPELNQAYPAYFSDPYPAREAVGVSRLPLGAQIEISVIAKEPRA